MNELIIVRHGQAGHMVNGLTGGWTDTHLTELGRRQARLTGQYLAGIIGNRQTRLYSSNLLRAVETAEIVSGSLAVSPVLASDLRELNNGDAAGLTLDEAAKIANPVTEPLVDWPPYPGAENWRAMSERVITFLDGISGEQSDVTMLVTHGGSGNAAICWWLGLETGRHNISFELDPCSVSRLSVNRWGERTVLKLNDTAHLIALNAA